MNFLIKIVPAYGKYMWYVYYNNQLIGANGVNTEDEANEAARQACDLYKEMYPEEGYSYDYKV